MKNRIAILVSLSLLFGVAIGCNFGGLIGSDKGSGSDTSTESGDKPSSDSEPGSTGEIVKVGIPECDELATYINDNAEAIGKDSIVVRGIVEMYKQTIFSSLRDSVENMNEEEKTKMGENCKKALENLKKQVTPKD